MVASERIVERIEGMVATVLGNLGAVVGNLSMREPWAAGDKLDTGGSTWLTS